MADTVEWVQRNEYYWAGPPGWTICRVFVDGMWQYELWFSRGDGGTIYGMRASLAAAQELFNQKLMESKSTEAVRS